MKKVVTLLVLTAAFVFSTAAVACPKGTHPHGGTGSHHAGGTCY